MFKGNASVLTIRLTVCVSCGMALHFIARYIPHFFIKRNLIMRIVYGSQFAVEQENYVVYLFG